jgi:hypothetical protein
VVVVVIVVAAAVVVVAVIVVVAAVVVVAVAVVVVVVAVVLVVVRGRGIANMISVSKHLIFCRYRCYLRNYSEIWQTLQCNYEYEQKMATINDTGRSD